MSISSDATPDEKDSPFYKANRKLCENWQKFIEEKDGKCTGVYNSSSLNFKAKLNTRRTWLISVKKATYSNGFLLFSSKYQNLQEILEIQCNVKNTNYQDFRIEKSRWKANSASHDLYRLILEFLSAEKKGKDPVSAEFRNGRLTIRFHHRNDDFELVERILNLDIA